MQQVRLHRDLLPENNMREGGGNLSMNRTDPPSYINDHPQASQRHCRKSLRLSDESERSDLDHDRLESLEREMASLKGQVTQSFVSPINEHELNRTLSSKKPSANPIRVVSPARLPLTHPHRKLSNEEIPIVSTNDGPFSRALPQVPVIRSKTFHNSILHSPASPPTNSSEEANFLRSYKAHIEQVLRKDAPPYSDIKVPNYNSIDDVMKANEQLLVENDRLRSELNRLKTESILLLRSMRTTNGIEPNLGNERVSIICTIDWPFDIVLFLSTFQIIAERERQELAIELARQVEENKRLRRSLLAQSAKFLTLRQSNNSNDASLSTSHDHRLTPVRHFLRSHIHSFSYSLQESAPQSTVNFNRIQQPSKSTRFVLGSRGMARPRTFNNGSHDPV